MAKKRRRIGDFLLEAGVIAPLQLEEALDEQKRTGEFLGQVLVRRGWVTENNICDCLHQQLGLPVVHLEGLDIPDHVLALVSEKLATRYLAMPIAVEGRHDWRAGRLDAFAVGIQAMYQESLPGAEFGDDRGPGFSAAFGLLENCDGFSQRDAGEFLVVFQTA